MDRLAFGRDAVSGAILASIAVVYYLDARSLPEGPAFFPTLLAGALFTLSVTIFIRGSRPGALALPDARKPILGIVLVGIYAALFERVGFLPATLGYTATVAWLAGARGRRAIIIPLSITTFIYVVFDVALGVPLP